MLCIGKFFCRQSNTKGSSSNERYETVLPMSILISLSCHSPQCHVTSTSVESFIA